MERIAVFGNDRQEEHLEELRDFLAVLPDRFQKIYIEEGFDAYLRALGFDTRRMVRVDRMPEDAECLVSIGGDGTFLRAVAWQGKRQLPILGINTGHLGFLASHSLADPEGIINELLTGKALMENRMMLEVSAPGMPGDIWPYVLNEVSVVKGDTTSMVNVRALVDGCFLADYLADGLVVCTPTGSTAYSLSAGGPILQPTLKDIVLTPIAAHSLTMRPVVISPYSEVRLEISSRGEECHVGLDGRMFSLPGSGASVTVRKAPFVVRVMHNPGSDFATILRSKLHWGQR